MESQDSPTVTQVVSKHYIIARKSAMRSKKHDTLAEALENSVCIEFGYHAEEAFYLDRAVELLEKAGWIYAGEAYNGK